MVTGTPVVAPASTSEAATAFAITSSWIVSPLMMHPSATTAWYCPDRAAAAAAVGISNAPGTAITVAWARSGTRRCSSDTAPSRSRSVIHAL